MIYANNKQVGLSANEVSNLVTKLVKNKQDKKIVFEGQEMLLTTALQRVNIQPKSTIDDTATDDDIPSAKGVWDLFNSKHLYLHMLNIRATSTSWNYRCKVNMFTNTSDKIDTPVKLWDLMKARGHNSKADAYPVSGGASYAMDSTPTNITCFYTSATRGLFRFDGNEGLGKTMTATLSGGTLNIISEFKSLTWGSVPENVAVDDNVVTQIF